MKVIDPRPFADPEAAARKLVELANAFEPVQDGRIYIEKINGPDGSRIMRRARRRPSVATHSLLGECSLNGFR
jgi:hypothetical protein